jgi:hypothetical protein
VTTDEEAFEHFRRRGVPDAALAVIRSLLPPHTRERPSRSSPEYPGMFADMRPTRAALARRPQTSRVLEFLQETYGTESPTINEARSVEIVREAHRYFERKGWVPAPDRNTILKAAGRRR